MLSTSRIFANKVFKQVVSAMYILLRWQKKPFSIGEEVALAQFHLADAGYGETIGISGRRDR